MEPTRPIGPHIITFGTPSWKPKENFWKNILLAELINSFPETIALIKLLVAHFNLSRSATIHRIVIAHVFKVKYFRRKNYRLLLLRDRITCQKLNCKRNACPFMGISRCFIYFPDSFYSWNLLSSVNSQKEFYFILIIL